MVCITKRLDKFLILCLTLIYLVIFVGCATVPLKKFDIPPKARIGIINLLENEMTHNHFGSTIFTNYIDNYEVDWRIPETIEKELKQQISANSHYEVINLEASESIKAACREDKFIICPWNEFKLNPNLERDFQKLYEEHNVNLIFVIRSYFAEDYRGGTGKYIGGYGLYTHTFLGMTETSYVYARIRIDVIWTNPPTLTGMAFHSAIADDLPNDMDLAKFGSLKNLPLSELNKIESLIKDNIPDMVKAVLMSSNISK